MVTYHGIQLGLPLSNRIKIPWQFISFSKWNISCQQHKSWLHCTLCTLRNWSFIVFLEFLSHISFTGRNLSSKTRLPVTSIVSLYITRAQKCSGQNSLKSTNLPKFPYLVKIFSLTNSKPDKSYMVPIGAVFKVGGPFRSVVGNTRSPR